MRSSLAIRPLSTGTNITFECGREDQNQFLQERALLEQHAGFSRTHLAYRGEELVGYVALCCAQARLGKADLPDGAPISTLPALMIAQFAVATAAQRSGVGEFLFRFALGTAQTLRALTGCRYLTVDAIPDALAFYAKYGFQRNDLEQRDRELNARRHGRDLAAVPIRMFLDIAAHQWQEVEFAPPVLAATQLHVAAGNGDLDLLRALLASGADPNVRAGRNDDGIDWGITPLHAAVARGQIEAMQVLINYGADIDALDGELSTPIHVAVRFGNTAAVRLLVESGANLNVEGGAGVLTALDYAANKGLPDLYAYLKAQGAMHSKEWEHL
ncbi:GNAT family N-acetyltransferase [Archangium violaceum]|uniref:GNAT family N-acetyltransferase n=1 Tax=Archangium violaceum TaxID=83451 RepID=UPI002B2FBF6C|nr:GNAT family N-acetyltransferase [Archangium violaceum]